MATPGTSSLWEGLKKKSSPRIAAMFTRVPRAKTRVRTRAVTSLFVTSATAGHQDD